MIMKVKCPKCSKKLDCNVFPEVEEIHITPGGFCRMILKCGHEMHYNIGEGTSMG